ncbi:unnamed protein product [Leuciscus chuanchicus]
MEEVKEQDEYHPSDHTESMKMRADATLSTSTSSGAVPKQKSILSSFVAITPYEKCSKRSKYVLPGRKYFSKTALPQLYEECRGKLENNLRNVRYFATTTDIWSSRTSEPYMSLTIHYIDEEWALQSRCSQTAFYPDNHTAKILTAGP